MELSQQAGDYTRLIEACQAGENVVGCAAAMIAESQRNAP
jgi:hypothetical protein